MCACGSHAAELPDAAAPLDVASALGNGGVITIESHTEGYTLHVELYASATPDTAPVPPVVGDGHCDVVAATVIPPKLTVVDRDLGAQITATDGPATVVAPVVQSDATYTYDGVFAIAPPDPATTWTLASDAVALPAVALPGRITGMPSRFGPDGDVPRPVGTPVTIDYTGGDSADYIHIVATGSHAIADCYPVVDAHAFTIPATVLDALIIDDDVAGDRDIGVVTNAETRALVTIAGRSVVVSGVARGID